MRILHWKHKKEFLMFFIVTTVYFVVPVYAQDGVDTWEKYIVTDRFGDPTGEYVYRKGVFGEGANSRGRKSTQLVNILYHPVQNVVNVALIDTSRFSIPLNILFMGPEAVTLYIKDNSGKTYNFNGTQMSSDDGQVSIEMNKDSSLVSLLRRNDKYKAVIEGNHWKCNFSFTGGMPQ